MYVRQQDSPQWQRFIEFLLNARKWEKAKKCTKQRLYQQVPWNSLVPRQYSENSLDMEIERYSHISSDVYMMFPQPRVEWESQKEQCKGIISLALSQSLCTPLNTFTDYFWVILRVFHHNVYTQTPSFYVFPAPVLLPRVRSVVRFPNSKEQMLLPRALASVPLYLPLPAFLSTTAIWLCQSHWWGKL